MTALKVGDRVSWWETFKNTKETPRTMTGAVVSVHGAWVGIHGEGDGFLGGTWVRDVAKLTVVTPSDTAVVRAWNARELPDDVRTRAISSLRDLVDDYDFAVGNAGDLGGAEIDLRDMTA